MISIPKILILGGMASGFAGTVEHFLRTPDSEVFSQLSNAIEREHPEIFVELLTSWRRVLPSLKGALASLSDEFCTNDWGVLLEFSIPRRRGRVDAVLLAAGIIFVLEFKTTYSSSAVRQVEDYALDLRDFHQPSAGRFLVPVVVATDSIPDAARRSAGSSSGVEYVLPAIVCDGGSLDSSLRKMLQVLPHAATLPPNSFDEGGYQPVPQIVAAAQTLFAGHDVREIASSSASQESLGELTEHLQRLIARAERQHERLIVFVTGVPGAGKTLVGLNSVHSQAVSACFLSGNGPLVSVLQEALARDAVERLGCSKGQARREASVFIQPMYLFVKAHFKKGKPCPENVIVFDEAQRAWNKKQNKRKKVGDISEPEIVLRIMEAVPNWCVVIALIGGGQEIHDGEAGLEEWGRALQERQSWSIVAPPEALHGEASLAGHTLALDDSTRVEIDPMLHLAVPLRQPRCEGLAQWVNAVLAGDQPAAVSASQAVRNYPIVLTRSLTAARAWLRDTTLGSRRYGLLASSGAVRLRAEGIETTNGFQKGYPYGHWFLAGEDDYRSSYQLEVAATEFKIQGLEIDRACVCWGSDLVWDGGDWLTREIPKSSWKTCNSEDRRFKFNKYRVLLTRARDAMVLYVPHGSLSDGTREPGLLDETARYLLSCGARQL